ncbi:unnamed protein product [Adineta steineri]|uniref:Uncharacterized protein n=2 Tax=Adineta steineri TaxID=433720 RepID=A0A814HC49_9BILA|nr:unnamed protein product [Adineta steineri]CAF0984755.1 unnamed protein product [Adineta steineri]CAF1008079.1 unnamed protein product [Adineta steineri]CAF1433865.1 unnamed protein product [Adineta steineri]CAF1625318.1 unnamed protein product [Adineta steineri]
MELDSEVSTDKISMIKTSTNSQKPPSLEQQPDVVRTRKIILILIGILLFLCIICFIFVFHSLATSDSKKDQSPNSGSQLVSVFISIIYYCFGLLVTYRYYQTGLLVFAWLGFVTLLSMLAFVIIILVGIIVNTSHLGVAKGVIVAIIFIIICLTASLVQIFTVRYVFILSKLLKNTKRLTIERI